MKNEMNFQLYDMIEIERKTREKKDVYLVK